MIDVSSRDGWGFFHTRRRSPWNHAQNDHSAPPRDRRDGDRRDVRARNRGVGAASWRVLQLHAR